MSDSAPLYRPTPQFAHAVLLVLYLPTGYDFQNALLVSSWYFPLGQSVHDADDAATLASTVPLALACDARWLATRGLVLTSSAADAVASCHRSCLGHVPTAGALFAVGRRVPPFGVEEQSWLARDAHFRSGCGVLAHVAFDAAAATSLQQGVCDRT